MDQKTKYVKKETIDIAEDIVYRWFSFIRFDSKISQHKLTALFVQLKMLCLKHGLSSEISGKYTQLVINNWLTDCKDMLINDPDVQHHLVNAVDSLIQEIRTQNKKT